MEIDNDLTARVQLYNTIIIAGKISKIGILQFFISILLYSVPTGVLLTLASFTRFLKANAVIKNSNITADITLFFIS